MIINEINEMTDVCIKWNVCVYVDKYLCFMKNKNKRLIVICKICAK